MKNADLSDIIDEKANAKLVAPQSKNAYSGGTN